MNWLFILIAAMVTLLILRWMARALSRFVIDLLLILIGLALLLAILPSNILNKIYDVVPGGAVEIIKEPIAALRARLPFPY